MLGHEHVAVRDGPEDHLADLDPVLGVAAGKEGLELVAALEGGRAVVHHGRLGVEVVQQAHGDVAVQEGHPLQHEPPHVVHALLVAPPVLQPKPHEVLQDVQPLRGANECAVVRVFFCCCVKVVVLESLGRRIG